MPPPNGGGGIIIRCRPDATRTGPRIAAVSGLFGLKTDVSTNTYIQHEKTIPINHEVTLNALINAFGRIY